MAVYCKGDGQWHQPGLAEEGPDQQMPVMDTFFSQNTEPEAGPEEREDPLDIHGYGNIRGFKFFQEIPDPPVEVIGRIDMFHD